MAEIERLVLTPAEAAAMLGISTRTLRDLKRKGLIAWVPFGRGGIGYRREDVLACRDAAVRRSGPPAREPRAPRPIAAKRQQPAWLAEAAAQGRVNTITGKPFGSTG